MPSTRSSVAIASSYSRRSWSSAGGERASPPRRARPASRAGRRSAAGARPPAPARSPSRATPSSPATWLTIPSACASCAVDPAAGQHELHRALLADHAREPLGAAAARDDPEQDLRLAELGRLGGDDHVAGERQLAAAAERAAGHGGDHRRPDRRACAARSARTASSSASWKLRSRIALMSAPAAKYLVAARDHDAADRRGRRPSLAQLAPAARPSARPRARCAHRAGSAGRSPTRPRARRASWRLGRHQVIALMPVTARPMISFWICDVPS